MARKLTQFVVGEFETVDVVQLIVVVVVPRGRKVGGVSRAVFVPFGFIARDVSLEIRRVVAVVNRRVLLWLVTTGRRGIVVRGQLRVP